VPKTATGANIRKMVLDPRAKHEIAVAAPSKGRKHSPSHRHLNPGWVRWRESIQLG